MPVTSKAVKATPTATAPVDDWRDLLMDPPCALAPRHSPTIADREMSGSQHLARFHGGISDASAIRPMWDLLPKRGERHWVRPGAPELHPRRWRGVLSGGQIAVRSPAAALGLVQGHCLTHERLERRLVD